MQIEKLTILTWAKKAKKQATIKDRERYLSFVWG